MRNISREQKILFNKLAVRIGESIQVRKPSHFKAGILQDVSMSSSRLGLTISGEYTELDLDDEMQITVVSPDRSGFEVLHPVKTKSADN